MYIFYKQSPTMGVAGAGDMREPGLKVSNGF